jgi:hypothetical protein
VAHQKSERQADTPPRLCSTERRMAVHQLPRTHEHAPGGARLIYFFEDFFDLPDFFLNFAGVFFGVAFGL